jgi:hypothetical protein
MNWGIFRGPNGCSVDDTTFVRTATFDEVASAMEAWIDTDGMGEGFIAFDGEIETFCWPMTAENKPNIDAFDVVAEKSEECCENYN